MLCLHCFLLFPSGKKMLLCSIHHSYSFLLLASIFMFFSIISIDYDNITLNKVIEIGENSSEKSGKKQAQSFSFSQS